MQKDADAAFAVMCTPDDDPAIPAFAALAAELGIWLLIGSLAVRIGCVDSGNGRRNVRFVRRGKGGG